MLFEENLILALETILPPDEYNFPFVFAYRNHTEVADPYCLVEQVAIYPTHQAQKNTSNKTNEGDYEILYQPMNCIFNLSFYSSSDSDLQEVSRRFQVGLQSSGFGFAFAEQDLSVVELTRLVYSEESINSTTMLKRATIQITVSGIVEEKWLLTHIKEVDFIGKDSLNKTLFSNNYLTEENKWQK